MKVTNYDIIGAGQLWRRPLPQTNYLGVFISASYQPITGTEHLPEAKELPKANIYMKPNIYLKLNNYLPETKHLPEAKQL